MIRRYLVFPLAIAALLACAGPVVAAPNTSEASGQVLDQDGNPVQGVRVTFSPDSNPTMAYDATTNKKGRYFVVGMFSPSGDEWRISLEAEGWVPVEMTVESRTVNRVLVGDVRTRKIHPGQDIPKVVIKQLGAAKIDFVVATPEQARAMRVAQAQQQAAEAGGEAAAAATQKRDPWDEALDIASQGDLEGSLPLFEKAIEDEPDSAERVEAYAKVLYQLERYDEARAKIERAIELKPGSVSALMVLYGIQVGLDDLDGASQTLEHAREIEPDNLQVLQQRAFVAEQRGDSEAAIAAYEGITEMHPDNADAWVALGDLYAAAGRSDKSEAAYERVVELEPANAHQVFYNIGALIMNKPTRSDAETKKAIASFRKSLEIKPDYAPAHKQLAFALLGVGDRAGAAQALEEYVELDPSAPDAAQMQALVKTLQK